MSSIVQLSDFLTGDFKIAQNRLTQSDLQVFIDQREREYLVKLLGAELYGLFYADLSGDPLTPDTEIYQTIFEAGEWDLPYPIISNGIRYMLQGAIYFHYVRDNNMYHTITGQVSNNNENSNAEVKDKGAQVLVQKYADAMKTYDSIQCYINDNLSDYPTFNGICSLRTGFFW